MGSMIKKIKRISTLRVISQFAALVLLSLPFFGLRSICGPAFHCHGCPLSAFACPIGVLVNFSMLKIFPYVAIGILGAIGTIGGRIVCGWVCPFGLLQDGLHKLPTRKISLPQRLGNGKYIVLVVLVLMVPFFFPGSSYIFCKLCPAATLETTIPFAFMGVFKGYTTAFIIKMSILVGVLGLAVVASRGFCRTICPLGAIFSLFNKISLFRLNLTKHDCNDCGACMKKCPVQIDPVNQMNSAECIRCLDCTTTRHLKLGSS